MSTMLKNRELLRCTPEEREAMRPLAKLLLKLVKRCGNDIFHAVELAKEEGFSDPQLDDYLPILQFDDGGGSCFHLISTQMILEYQRGEGLLRQAMIYDMLFSMTGLPPFLPLAPLPPSFLTGFAKMGSAYLANDMSGMPMKLFEHEEPTKALPVTWKNRELFRCTKEELTSLQPYADLLVKLVSICRVNGICRLEGHLFEIEDRVLKDGISLLLKDDWHCDIEDFSQLLRDRVMLKCKTGVEWRKQLLSLNALECMRSGESVIMSKVRIELLLGKKLTDAALLQEVNRMEDMAEFSEKRRRKRWWESPYY